MLPGYSELHSSSILKELSSWRVKKAAGCSCRELEKRLGLPLPASPLCLALPCPPSTSMTERAEAGLSWLASYLARYRLSSHLLWGQGLGLILAEL